VSGAQRFALLIEYDGTQYVGSQFQTNGPTIQGTIEAVIERLTGQASRLALAGRTDSGAHALGQVGAVTLNHRWTSESLRKGLNALLPPDIAIRATAVRPPDFDPRRDARRRWYRYTIYNREVRPALARHFVWHVRERLDIGRMSLAAARLVGEHDFAAFAGPYKVSGASTRRTVYRAEVSEAGPELRFDIEANAFLPHQVRRTVGSLVQVGSGRLGLEALEAAAAAAVPASLGPAAPSHGLCLMRVTYDEPLFSSIDESCPRGHDRRPQ
jgi:tRNA pseudouridine38-40 synthase